MKPFAAIKDRQRYERFDSARTSRCSFRGAVTQSCNVIVVIRTEGKEGKASAFDFNRHDDLIVIRVKL